MPEAKISQIFAFANADVPARVRARETRLDDTSAAEMTRFYTKATVPQAEQAMATEIFTYIRAWNWVETHRLRVCFTKCFGGQFRWLDTPASIEESSEALRRALDNGTPAAHDLPVVSRELPLAEQLLSPQARDALTALKDNAHECQNLDSDGFLALLNASPTPIYAPPTRTVALHEEVLSPQVQDELTAIARGTRSEPEDSDAMLAILNAGNSAATEDDDDDDGASLFRDLEAHLADLDNLYGPSDGVEADLIAAGYLHQASRRSEVARRRMVLEGDEASEFDRSDRAFIFQMNKYHCKTLCTTLFQLPLRLWSYLLRLELWSLRP
ncbi:hypothetical protein DFH06DRAFT_1375967 [Mycena polygramma]|nr:hypothetical protein DFH06DRAFT_1375967 [Mycena polygramma]